MAPAKTVLRIIDGRVDAVLKDKQRRDLIYINADCHKCGAKPAAAQMPLGHRHGAPVDPAGFVCPRIAGGMAGL